MKTSTLDQANEPIIVLHHGQIGSFHHPTHVYLLHPSHAFMGAKSEIKFVHPTATLAQPDVTGPTSFSY